MQFDVGAKSEKNIASSFYKEGTDHFDKGHQNLKNESLHTYVHTYICTT
jgi:hypothetical protein